MTGVVGMLVKTGRGGTGGVYQPSVPDKRVQTTNAHIYTHTHARVYTLVKTQLSPTPETLSLESPCGVITQTRREETPLTGTGIADITFIHMIPHQFLETKAGEYMTLEQLVAVVVGRAPMRASISPGMAVIFYFFLPCLVPFRSRSTINALLFVLFFSPFFFLSSFYYRCPSHRTFAGFRQE